MGNEFSRLQFVRFFAFVVGFFVVVYLFVVASIIEFFILFCLF
jgi:hypothetical protein